MSQPQQGFPNVSAPFVGNNGQITSPWRQLLLSLWSRTGASQGGVLVPSGQIIAYAGTVAPTGWLLCNGNAIDRITYAALFAAIGTVWGVGDGSSTFNIPNLVGRTLLGNSVAYALGSSGGQASITLTTAQLPAHSHGITDPGHVHASVVSASNVTSGSSAGGVSAGNTSSATTGITVNNTGSGNPIPSLPPYAAIQWLIKT